MTSDPLDEIKAKADADWKAFDAQVQRRVAAYRRAKTAKARLLLLAKILRQHGEWLSDNIFTGGYPATGCLQIADEMEDIATEL